MDSTTQERIEHLREEERETLDRLEAVTKPTDYGDDTDSLDEETDESTDAANRAGEEAMLRERLAGIRKAISELEG